MKAEIYDVDALKAITPAALAAFARQDGWRRGASYGKHSDIYVADGKPELVLPRTNRIGDYARVVATVLSIFADVRDDDQTSVYRDVIGSDRDVLRVRAAGGTDDGSVPIDVGVETVVQARQILLAAACAAQAPQSIFRAGANKEAADYMRRVRLGQTEHGSFVVTLLAPVPPMLQAELEPSWVAWEDEPFERQVTRRLVESLEACRSASEKAAAGNGLAAFDASVEQGVSANLCEALAALLEQVKTLDVSVTWAKTRPTPETSRTVTFSDIYAEVLKEAARTFRSRHPRPDVELFGTVNKLKRDSDEVEGLVTLRAMIDGKLQSVRAVLDQANYSVAVQAHDAQVPVIIRGDLERVRQRWQLTNGTVSRAAGSDDDDAGS